MFLSETIQYKRIKISTEDKEMFGCEYIYGGLGVLNMFCFVWKDWCEWWELPSELPGIWQRPLQSSPGFYLILTGTHLPRILSSSLTSLGSCLFLGFFPGNETPFLHHPHTLLSYNDNVTLIMLPLSGVKNEMCKPMKCVTSPIEVWFYCVLLL